MDQTHRTRLKIYFKMLGEVNWHRECALLDGSINHIGETLS